MIEAFVRHRREVVTRRTIFELRKARERAHVLEGLAVALANIEAGHRAHPGLRQPRGGQTAVSSSGDWEPGSVRAMLDRTGAGYLEAHGSARQLRSGGGGSQGTCIA